MRFANKVSQSVRRGGEETTDLTEIYVLNLVVTVGMFAVLMFRAWLEQKHYRMLWREMEWRQTYQTMGRLLKAEKDMFSRVEGGDELYQMLCEMFKVNEK